MIFKKEKTVLLFSFITLTGIIGCGTNKESEEKNIMPQGHYVNNTFLDRVADSLPGTIPVYCYEMRFAFKDSLDINFGFETARFVVSRTENNLTIKNACAKGDLNIILNPDSSLTLVDSSWTGLKTNSVFQKSDLLTKNEWHFDHYLNERMLVGKYSIDTSPTASQISIVEFDAWGKVNGIDQFVSYKICYSGDCVGLTSPLSNTIEFTDIRGNTRSFAFSINKTPNRHINIYKLGESQPDIKGEIPIKEKYIGLSEFL